MMTLPVLRIEMDLNELSKSRAVIVPGGLGIAKRLQNWIGIENLLLQRTPAAVTKVVAEVLEDVLGRLGLAGVRLARDDDGLRLL